MLQEQISKLKKATFRLMKHKETSLYSGVILMGKSELLNDIPTACTDGINKFYGIEFLSKQSIEEATALVLHENLHVQLMHIPRHRNMMKEDAKLANAAMDYVVNGIINNLKDKTLCKLPAGGLYDAKFDDWSVREIYNYLKSGQHGRSSDPDDSTPSKGTPQQGKDKAGNDVVTIGKDQFKLNPMDKHDETGINELDKEGQDELREKVTEAIHQGTIIADRMGVEVPRAIRDAVTPIIDWQKELSEFFTSSIKGDNEYNWRSLDRMHVGNDILLPITDNETLTEAVVAIDTSGSIDDELISMFGSVLAGICESCSPDKVRVLWWDTMVHSEQVFTEGTYGNLRSLLKPMGGGGTRAGCVSDYIVKHNLKPDCLVMLTDGYIESKVVWDTKVKSLWMVTHNEILVPPNGGRKVNVIK